MIECVLPKVGDQGAADQNAQVALHIGEAVLEKPRRQQGQGEDDDQPRILLLKDPVEKGTYKPGVGGRGCGNPGGADDRQDEKAAIRAEKWVELPERTNCRQPKCEARGRGSVRLIQPGGRTENFGE